MTVCYIDIETCSDVDLGFAGLGKYAADPSTRIYMVQYAIGDQDVQVWLPIQDATPPRALIDFITGDGKFVAHNALFDKTVIEALFPNLATPLSRWVDTAAVARLNGLPGSLEGACRRLGIEQQKDTEGAKILSNYYSKAPTGMDLFRIMQYGIQDVVAMRELYKVLGDLTPFEQQVWEATSASNCRGLPVDVAGATMFNVMADLAKAEANKELARLSGGAVTATTQYPALLAFAKSSGYSMGATDKGSVDAALADPDCPRAVKDVLEQWQLCTTTPKKHVAILKGQVDERLSHTILYHGAMPTGRWTARGAAQFQAHNFARPRPQFEAPEKAEAIYQAARRGDWAALNGEFGPPLAALADCQRHLIRAKDGHKIVAADLSAIEARISPWYTGEEKILQDFRDGKDMYKASASQIYGVPYDEVTKQQRQQAKVVTLACLAGDTKVLTSNGVKKITEIQIDDKLWDGVEWVSHDGVVCNGTRETVNVSGVDMTKDHLIFNGETWQQAKDMLESSEALSQAHEWAKSALPETSIE